MDIVLIPWHSLRRERTAGRGSRFFPTLCPCCTVARFRERTSTSDVAHDSFPATHRPNPPAEDGSPLDSSGRATPCPNLHHGRGRSTDQFALALGCASGYLCSVQ